MKEATVFIFVLFIFVLICLTFMGCSTYSNQKYKPVPQSTDLFPVNKISNWGIIHE